MGRALRKTVYAVHPFMRRISLCLGAMAPLMAVNARSDGVRRTPSNMNTRDIFHTVGVFIL